MKLLLVVLLPLFFAAQAQTWPRNPKTGKVEFHGTLPWPKAAKTEAKRMALVRRWYLTKLTDLPADAVSRETRETVSPSLLTYGRLPTSTILRSGSGPGSLLLSSTLYLAPVNTGLTYTLSEFNCTVQGSNGAEDVSTNLEATLSSQNQQAALAALRKRLASAVAGW